VKKIIKTTTMAAFRIRTRYLPTNHPNLLRSYFPSEKVVWTAEAASTWSDDHYELQRRREPLPPYATTGTNPSGAAGSEDDTDADDANTSVWATVYVGPLKKHSFSGLSPGEPITIRARTVNASGASPYTSLRTIHAHQVGR